MFSFLGVIAITIALLQCIVQTPILADAVSHVVLEESGYDSGAAESGTKE